MAGQQIAQKALPILLALVLALDLVALLEMEGRPAGGRVTVSQPKPAGAPPAQPPHPSQASPALQLPTGVQAAPDRASSLVVEATGNEVAVYDAPSPGARVRTKLPGLNDIDQPQTFLVLKSAPGWYEVLVPVRPNGSTGWVRADQVRQDVVTHYIRAILSDYRLEHYVDGRLQATYRMAVGAAKTPTPSGLYYVWATLLAPGPPYDPIILALSGFSPDLVDWPGGGRAGIHGWGDPGVMGKKVSAGCLRLTWKDAIKLAEVPLGTPVEILA